MIPKTVKPDVTTTKHLFCAEDLCGGMYLCSHLRENQKSVEKLSVLIDLYRATGQDVAQEMEGK